MSSESIPYGVPGEIASREGQLDPYPFFDHQRRTTPVRYDEQRDTYDVFRYGDIERVISDTDAFSKADVPRLFEKSLMDLGPEDYRLIGGVVEDAFTPKAVADRRDEVEELAEDVLSSALAEGDTVQFVDEVAKPFPIRVIARFLGVPTDRIDEFRDWSLTLTEAPAELTTAAFRANIEEKKAALSHMSAFFEDLVEQRLAAPRDDLVTALVHAEGESARHTRQHTIDTCNFLLLAGNVTTTALLTNAIWTLVEEGAVQDIREGSLDLGSAIEEVLRYRSPVMSVQRMTQEPVEVGGVSIEAGTQVSAWITSANRDPAVFDHPERFDPDRDDLSAAMPFGKGMRFCLGAHLARLEAEILLSKFIERTDRIALQSRALEPYISQQIFGPQELPLSISR